MNIVEENILWEEKNSTEPNPNSLTSGEHVNENIISNTKKDSTKKDLKDIIGTIYLIKNNINGKRYVGQTIQKLNYRWKQHIRDSEKMDYPLYLAMRKYGVENFSISALEIVDYYNELEDYQFASVMDYLERKHVIDQKSFIDWNKGGYNLTEGGWGHHKVSRLTKNKLSKSLSGKPKSLEHSRKVGLANRGKLNARRVLTTLTFYNEITKETFSGIRSEFYKKYHLDTRKVYDLIKGLRKYHLGWKFISANN